MYINFVIGFKNGLLSRRFIYINLQIDREVTMLYYQSPFYTEKMFTLTLNSINKLLTKNLRV